MIAAALHFAVVIALTIRILLRDEMTPSARLAWFMVIAVVPLGGSVLYFLFGEANLGYSAKDRIVDVWHRIRTQGDVFHIEGALHQVPDRFAPTFAYSESINAFPSVAGNVAELMPDAETARARMIADIDAATDHVHVLYYIWLDDQTGTNMARALIRAAQRGVTCRAMADAMGSRKLIKSPLWQKMRDAGVELAVALPIGNPIRTILKSRIDLRNHRKITIIDGQITYCGSQNCADPEFRVKPKFAPWVDIMLRVQGPVVAQNQVLFASDWIAHCGGSIEDFALTPEHHTPGCVAQIMGDGPTERHLATPHLFSILLAAAEHSVTISTPYFVPDTIVAEAICATAFRGVQVDLILPKRNDSRVVAAVSQSTYRRLLQAGVRIHEFKGGLLHAKTITVDGQVSLVGSSNLDLRSFDLNYESNLLLHDADVTGQILARQQDYIADADPVHMADVDAWPMLRRMWNNAVATVGPIL